jgi:hypothetical protein
LTAIRVDEAQLAVPPGAEVPTPPPSHHITEMQPT